MLIVKTIDYFDPTLAVIRSFEYIGFQIHGFVTHHGDICRCRIMRRDFDRVYDPLGEIGRGYILPVFSSISGEVHKAIIASRPKNSFLMWRLHQGHECIVVFTSRSLICEWLAPRTLLALVISCQVRADDFPGRSHVRGPENHIPRVINC